ncbi:DNA transformation protein [Loktanella ponticola]|uniref:DNA transformation protein n=1 Tax=Yoonia ponticola TaxID=1524255 RepID=A0A7W9BJL8_9RHOB|nr:TfoX/Sxy family protein [Yoonia ponticola]MBB5721767.1 DNA transformation protein [Yoonia ponticola]
MSLSDGDIAFAVDLFNDLGALTTRKMFGGMCLYHDGTVFALQSSDGCLYLKTKNPVALFDAQTDQFHNMPYYAIPEDILDDPDTACALARRALIAL